MSSTDLSAIDWTVDEEPYVDPYGNRHWWKGVYRHRINGPAVEYADGTCIWIRHNVRHRDDGPAVILPDGSCKWVLSGSEFTFDEWCSITGKTPEDQLMLRLKYAVK